MAKLLGAPKTWDVEIDLVSVGSSSGGLAAAIRAHDLGLSTVVLEKADKIGGGTSLGTPGALWMPCNHHMLEMGLSDSRDEALMYIRHISAGRHDEEVLAAYLDNGPEVLRYLEEHTPLRLMCPPYGQDYYPDAPGGKKGGRYLEPDHPLMAQVLTEAEKEHPLLTKLQKEPVPNFTGFATEFGGSGAYGAGRGLIGSLLLGCLNRGISVLTNTRARQLVVQDGRVIGLCAEREGRNFFVKGKRGVLLATGGYEWNEKLKKRFMGVPDIHAVTPPSNEGDGHIMGMEVGAAVALMEHAILVPTIRIPGEKFDDRPLNRLIGIGRPGNIVVNRYGKRCCNESFYAEVGLAFTVYEQRSGQLINLPMFSIYDQAHRDRNVIGPLPMGRQMAGWLHRANTIRELAEQLGLPPDNLEETVERFNTFARERRDPNFHREETVYAREPEETGGASALGLGIGPLEKPPFYGVQIHAGTVGTLGGLVINANAQVVDVRGEVIPGLYATSHAAASLVMGRGYNSGLSHAYSMVFGDIAARHMAQRR
jgi:succinate dehydrogenase/fumarate reductase flavoprotein subunit